MSRFKLLAGFAVVGMTSCGQSPAPPAVAVVPAVGVAEKPDPAIPVEKAAPVPADGRSFLFPDDTGGKALARTVTPAAPPPLPAAAPTVPRERKLPAFLDAIAPPLPDAAATPPRLGLPPIKGMRPVALPDRVPLELGGAVPDLPSRPEMPTGPLTRSEGRDVSKPAELPILSPKGVPDRAPLADPTAEFTAASVISPTLPLRTEPTGFVRVNLPDPFEHADAARVRTPVTEDPNRVLPR